MATTETTENPTPEEERTRKPRPTASKTPDGLDLSKLLLDGLKAQGVKATRSVAPSKHAYRVAVRGTTIAHVIYRAAGALRIRARLDRGEQVEGFKPVTEESLRQGLGQIGTFRDEAGIAQAVTALARAAANLEEAS
jgi:hypothetical protein